MILDVFVAGVMPVTISELDTAVTDLVASFTNLVKAARFTDESADTRKQVGFAYTQNIGASAVTEENAGLP